MRSPARLRDRRVLEAQLAALGPGETWDFRCGAVHALRWLTAGGPGPLTGVLEGPPVAVQAIVAELAAAEDLIYSASRTRGSSTCQDYARGVEHALMWAQFATAAPPVGGAGPVRDPEPHPRPARAD